MKFLTIRLTPFLTPSCFRKIRRPSPYLNDLHDFVCMYVKYAESHRKKICLYQLFHTFANQNTNNNQHSSLLFTFYIRNHFFIKICTQQNTKVNSHIKQKLTLQKYKQHSQTHEQRTKSLNNYAYTCIDTLNKKRGLYNPVIAHLIDVHKI